MKHTNPQGRQGEDPANDEASGERPAPAPVGKSGIRARVAVPPDPAAPCLTFEDVYGRYKHHTWLRIRARVRDPGAVADIHQNVFVTMARKIRQANGVPPRVERLLESLIEGEISNYLRVERRRRVAGEPDGDVMPSSKPDPEQQYDRAESAAAEKEAVLAIFARLTGYQRQLIELAHTEGLSLLEIGAIVDRSAGTVAVDLQRARERFRKVGAHFYNLLRGSRRKP